MKKNEYEKDTELFMLAQFIDVMEVLDSYKKIDEIKFEINKRKQCYIEYIKNMNECNEFLSLNLYDSVIDKKIKNSNKLYNTSKQYKDILEETKNKYKIFTKDFNEKDKEKLEELNTLIHKLSSFDVHLAYKIGLIEGIKLKNKCT